MPRYINVEDAYQNDVMFKCVVDTIESMLHRAELTPAEVRAAAVLACIHYEMRRIRSFRVRVGDAGMRVELDEAQMRIDRLRRWVDEEESDAPAD